MPEGAHGEGEPLGEDDAPVEDAVAVGVLEPDDAVGRGLEELLEAEVDAGGVAHVEAALVVEAGHDGPLDERRGRDFFDDEAGGDLEVGLVLRRRRGADEDDGRKGEQQAFHHRGS